VESAAFADVHAPPYISPVDTVKAETLGKGDVKLDKGKAKAVDELGHIEGSDLGTKVQTTEPAPKRRSIRASKSAITMVSLSRGGGAMQQMCFGLGCPGSEDFTTRDTPPLILQSGSMVSCYVGILGETGLPQMTDSPIVPLLTFWIIPSPACILLSA
jgi:hypothetical protein